MPKKKTVKRPGWFRRWSENLDDTLNNMLQRIIRLEKVDIDQRIRTAPTLPSIMSDGATMSAPALTCESADNPAELEALRKDAEEWRTIKAKAKDEAMK